MGGAASSVGARYRLPRRSCRSASAATKRCCDYVAAQRTECDCPSGWCGCCKAQLSAGVVRRSAFSSSGSTVFCRNVPTIASSTSDRVVEKGLLTRSSNPRRLPACATSHPSSHGSPSHGSAYRPPHSAAPIGVILDPIIFPLPSMIPSGINNGVRPKMVERRGMHRAMDVPFQFAPVGRGDQRSLLNPNYGISGSSGNGSPSR